jgi:precorrin-8X/cobalt-precorrin-8 methylmutase
MSPAVHPIEAESYRILAERLDLSDTDPGVAAVISRIVHASADLELGAGVVTDPASVAAGVEAVRAGAPVVCDVQMVRAGITAVETTCLLAEAPASPGGLPTRSATAIALAAERWPEGAVFVIGCAPTALFEIVRLVEVGRLRPALVIGLPVGFVGAAESKADLRRLAERRPGGRHLATISNVGEKGGSAVAAAAFNALVRLARPGVPQQASEPE